MGIGLDRSFDVKLSEARKQIDSIDARILYLLAERERVVCEILRAKVRHGRPVVDVLREEEILRNARDWPRFYLSPVLGVKVYEAILAWSRRVGAKLERRHRREKGKAR